MCVRDAAATIWRSCRMRCGAKSGVRVRYVRGKIMAKLPISIPEIVDAFGPHTKHQPAGGWVPVGEVDRLVKTHCCFCGQQCGIQLKVKNNQVVGFEPWEDFPFNRGKLCPKGVKRYLQGGHPDRLLDPLLRTDQGFRTATWDEALDFT